MKKLLLIDAYAMIYRAYYAFLKNPRINSKGMNTSAIYGFVTMLEDLLKRLQPTHVGVAFDPSGKTFRHEAYEAYKAQREETPEDIRKAVPYIKEIVKAYRIPILEVPGFEADDVIGTLAYKAADKDFQVFMATPDKDYGQLLTHENVFMYRPRHNGGFEQMGEADVCEKYGIENCRQVIDLLGLMGDASDNIPGCPGVGEKTAVKLLREFGDIDNLLAHTDQVKGALRNKIEENVEKIRFSRFLATIRVDVPVNLDEEALLLQSPNKDELVAIYSDLEFRQFLQKIQPPQQQQMSLFAEAEQQTDREMPVETVSLQRFHADNVNYHLVQTEEQITRLLTMLAEQTEICFDTETTDVNAMQAELVGMSFAWKKGEAYFVILPEKKETTLEILARFRPIFESDKIAKIGQNMKYDLTMLRHYGIALNGRLFDTMIAHYLIQPDLRHGMDYLAEIYLNYQTIHYDDLVGKGKKQLPLRQVALNDLSDYACEDADITWQLKQILSDEIEKNGLQHLFYDLEMPLMKVLADMEWVGVRIDEKALARSSAYLTQRMHEVEHEIYDLAGEEFNVSSPKQVGEVLFEKLKLDEKVKKTKTGQYSTSEEVLVNLRSKHPVVQKILDFREIKKLLSTYVDALPLMVNKKTQHLHTSYNQTVAVTGRLSSSNPNLQNIPIRSDLGRVIRAAFVPDEGCLFLSADYSQIELRIMAHLSGDEHMIEAFREGRDIHAATASKIYGVPLENVTSDMRRKAKTANFGIIYGISAFGLAERLDIPRTEAKMLIDGYFASYPRIKDFIDASIAKAQKLQYAETLLGRKRYLPDINSKNSVVRGFAERNAVNAPIQGTAADIIKQAMVRISERFKTEHVRSSMTMQVHDELNFSVIPEELELVKHIVVEEMENAMHLTVPLVADCGIGSNWLEAH